MQQQQHDDTRLDGISSLIDSEVVSSPVAPMPRLQLSPAGAAMVRKVLHPPSAVPNYEGLTTQDARTVQNLEFRSTTINPAPLQLAGAVYAADGITNTFGYLVPSGARVHAIGITAPQNNQQLMQQNAGDVVINDNYNFANWGDDANNHRLAYKSATFLCNNTAFSDTGILSCAQFRPTIVRGTATSIFRDDPKIGIALLRAHQKFILAAIEAREDAYLPDFGMHHTREQMKLFTVRSKLFDTPTACISFFSQLDKVSSAEQFAAACQRIAVDPNDLNQIAILNGLGATSGAKGFPDIAQVQQLTVRGYTGKFKDGCFTILRHNSAAPEYPSSNTTSITQGSQHFAGMFFCSTATVDTLGAPHVQLLVEQVSAGTAAGSAPHLVDTAWSDMTWSYVYATGITYNPAATPSATQSTGVWIRKFIAGIEVQPAPSSAWAATAKLAPEPDFNAMQELTRAFFVMKDGMPAKYNFLGVLSKLAPAIGGFVRTVAGDAARGFVQRKSQSKASNKPDASLTQKIDALERKMNALVAAPRKPLPPLSRQRVRPQPRRAALVVAPPLQRATVTPAAPRRRPRAAKVVTN